MDATATAGHRYIVIVGGGTAGWMTAAALAAVLHCGYRIRLVESAEIGVVGVGEATIPGIKLFNQAIGVDEDEFLRATQGTFKLGIEFVDWGRLGDRYLHGFGQLGRPFGAVPFHHYWLKQHRRGSPLSLDDCSLHAIAARRGRYGRSRPELAGSPLADIPNAFHFDAGLYGRYLRQRAERRGVERIEGTVREVELCPTDGAIAALQLADGRRIEGDFFVDCTGMRALLIGQALQEPYESWSHWLPCDRALAVPCVAAQPPAPYTRASARGAGWQWRIPLQHRVGNGLVYASAHLSDDAASAQLLGNLEGEALAPPRLIPFTPGRRRRTWVRNCVAVGLAAGFFEPIESTNIHLVQTAVQRLIQLFPLRGCDSADTAEYNRQTALEYEQIRDFVILHYKATARDDTAFWQQCRAMEIPASLSARIALFQASGRLFREGNELFGEPSWVQVMIGQGILPKAYHPLVDAIDEAQCAAFVDDVARVLGRCADALPAHADFIRAHCAAPSAP